MDESGRVRKIPALAPESANLRMSNHTWTEARSHAQEVCKRANRSFTLQRQAVLQTLWGASDHPTADQVFERVIALAPGLSRATVFRSLETLAEIGLARRVGHFGVGVRYDARLDPHHHFICQHCARISDFVDSTLDGLDPVTPPEFVVGHVFVTCIGACPDCRDVVAPTCDL